MKKKNYLSLGGDAAIVTPLQAATVAEASLTLGYALTFAYQKKIRGAA